MKFTDTGVEYYSIIALTKKEILKEIDAVITIYNTKNKTKLPHTDKYHFTDDDISSFVSVRSSMMNYVYQDNQKHTYGIWKNWIDNTHKVAKLGII